MEENEKRDWALDNEKPTELDEAVNFLNSRPHLYKNGQINRYAVGRIMIDWTSQKLETSDEALPIGDVGGNEVALCRCSEDETTGWIKLKCCNICGKPQEQ